MPWTAEDARKHKKGLSPEQARKWAKVANSALEQYGDEGRAIRVANSQVSKQLIQKHYIEVFAKALDEGFTDERAHRLAWTAIQKHGSHNQKDHGRRGAGGSKSRGSGGSGSGGSSGGGAKTGIFGSGRDQGRGANMRRGRGVPDGGAPILQQTTTPGTKQRVMELVAAGVTTAILLDVARVAARTAYGVAKVGDAPASPQMVLKVIRMVAEKRGIEEDQAAELVYRLAQKKGVIRPKAKERPMPFAKRDDTVEADTYVEFSKVDEDKRQVFGWAIVAKDSQGNDVIDLQGDMVSPDEVEKAAYDYVIHSRDGGEMHVRKGVSRMIESMVISPEKLEAMGIVAKGGRNSVPIGWWVGFEVTDEGVWKGVKDGRYTGFSIHGMGKRKTIGKRSDIEKARRLEKRAMDLLGQAVMHGDDEAVESLAKALRQTA